MEILPQTKGLGSKRTIPLLHNLKGLFNGRVIIRDINYFVRTITTFVAQSLGVPTRSSAFCTRTLCRIHFRCLCAFLSYLPGYSLSLCSCKWKTKRSIKWITLYNMHTKTTFSFPIPFRVPMFLLHAHRRWYKHREA